SSAVASSVLASAAKDDKRHIRILPVPMRVQSGEKEKLRLRREFAKDRFTAVLGPEIEAPDATLDRAKLRAFAQPTPTKPTAAFLLDAEVLYDPYYAYEE